MANTVDRIEGLPGPTGTVPFNESSYAHNVAFHSWNGRAKGGWIVQVTLNFGNVIDENNLQEVLSVPGVEVGDYCELTLFNDWQRLQYTAFVSIAGTVKIIVTNLTGSAVDPPAGIKALIRITDLT